MNDALKAEIQNSVLKIDFHRPEAGNSFGEVEAKSLLKIIAAHRKSARALLFRSSHPRLFCAGGDLKAHAKLKTKRAGLDQAKWIRKSFDALSAWPIPKAALVEGDCFGGGMEFLSCFDYRIAAPYVLFGFWQRRIGLSFGWGGFERWSKKISPDVIRSLGYSARVFGSQEALRLGLVHQIGGTNDVESWVRQVMRWSPESATGLAVLDAKNEMRTFESLWWSENHRAVLKKFSGQ